MGPNDLYPSMRGYHSHDYVMLHGKRGPLSKVALGAESDSQLTATKKAEASVLQLQGSEFCQMNALGGGPGASDESCSLAGIFISA